RGAGHAAAARRHDGDRASGHRPPAQPYGRLSRCDAVKFSRMARVRLVAGNWKMHGSRQASRALLDAILKEQSGGANCAVCPPFPYLAQAAEQLKGSAVALGAQNVSEHAQGAYTGEVSAAMLKDMGCRY